MSYANKNIKTSFVSSNVLLVTLDRKPVNAFNDDLWHEMADTFKVASSDPDVRAIILTSSSPKIFTAGLDLKESGLKGVSETLDTARSALALSTHIKDLQDAVSSIENCIKPVIVACHGICVGAGIDILSACDVAFCSAEATFSIKEIDVGLAADVGSLQRLPHKVGNDALLRELVYTARYFSSAEAKEVGLVAKVVEGGKEKVYEEALKTAKLIATKSPIAVTTSKTVLNYSREHTVQEGLDFVRFWNMSMLQTQDLKDAFAAFLEKKPAIFKNLPKL